MKRSLLLLPLLALAACQTVPYQPYAREVKKKPGTGGLIALKPEHRDEDRAKAQMLMETNCTGSSVKVTEEGEVVVGSTTTTDATTAHKAGTESTQVGTLWGMPLTSGGSDPSQKTSATASTTALKEWTINYECDKPVATSTGSKIAPMKKTTKN